MANDWDSFYRSAAGGSNTATAPTTWDDFYQSARDDQNPTTHSDAWKAEQADMRQRAITAGMPDISDGRDRLLNAIQRSEQSGFPLEKPRR